MCNKLLGQSFVMGLSLEPMPAANMIAFHCIKSFSLLFIVRIFSRPIFLFRFVDYVLSDNFVANCVKAHNKAD